MTRQQEPYDSSNEKHVARAKRRAANETQAEVNDLRAIMRTKEGRRTLWRLLSNCGVYRSVFDVQTPVMSFNEGARSVGLRYLALLTEYCLPEYQMMQNEQQRAAHSNPKED